VATPNIPNSAGKAETFVELSITEWTYTINTVKKITTVQLRSFR
jgi:hypothetical protein